MKKLLVFLPVVLVLLSTSNVFASGKPVRLVAPLPQPLVVSGSCTFDVDVKVIRNDEFTTSFFDASGNLVRQLTTGALVVSLTNLSNGHSVTVNISGPSTATFNGDGPFVQRFEGLSALPLPHQFLLTSGRVDIEFFPNADPVILSMSGTQTDLCAVLA